MTVAEVIENQLRKALEPFHLEIENESHRHRGHDGADDSGESHFRLVIKSKQFKGLTRIQRHRLVYKALSPHPMSRIHALRMELSAE